MKHIFVSLTCHARNPCKYWPVLLVLFLLGGITTGCDRPLKVTVNMAGAEKLPLKGSMGSYGILTRAIINGHNRFDKGTRIKVLDTWLKRKQKANPPGYRIEGYYDPEINRSGFVLPSGTINIFYLGVSGDSSTTKIVVPAEYFQPDR